MSKLQKLLNQREKLWPVYYKAATQMMASPNAGERKRIKELDRMVEKLDTINNKIEKLLQEM